MNPKLVTFEQSRAFECVPVMEGIGLQKSVLKDGYPLHWHDFYEIELIVQGQGTHWLNGEAAAFAPGCACMLTPRDMHRFQAQGEMQLLSLKINRAAQTPEMQRLLDADRLPCFVYLAPGLYEEINRIILDILKVMQFGGALGAYKLHALVMLLTVRLMEQAPSVRRPVQRMDRLQKAMAYIQQNYLEPVQLGQVAAAAGLSPAYVSSLFKEQVGCTFQSYLCLCRLQRAQALLARGQSVTQSAFDSGFGSISQFQRMFERHFGLTPSQYAHQARDAESAFPF